MSAAAAPAQLVRTVLGDVDPLVLGPTDYHEHLFQTSPLLPGDELDDEPASSQEAQFLFDSGCRTYVEATPVGLGRRPQAVARIARSRGLHVVHVTGAHREAHYPGTHPLLHASVGALHARFRFELIDGMVDDEGRVAIDPDGRPVRAGVLKAALDYWRITAFEDRVLEAVGQLGAELGAPIMVHLEHGSAAHVGLDRLDALGCPAQRVVLAHIDRNPDAGLMLELASRGAMLGFDGAARHREWPDSVLLDCIAEVVERGGGRNIVLGGDVARSTRFRAYGGMPGMSYLFARFVPRLRARIGDDATEQILVANPANWLAWPTAPSNRRDQQPHV